MDFITQKPLHHLQIC